MKKGFTIQKHFRAGIVAYYYNKEMTQPYIFCAEFYKLTYRVFAIRHATIVC